MKKMFRKNQVVVSALAVMIAVAGYLTYAGREGVVPMDTTQTAQTQSADEQTEEVLNQEAAAAQESSQAPQESEEAADATLEDIAAWTMMSVIPIREKLF